MQPPSAQRLGATAEALTGSRVRVQDVAWTATIPLQHRLAATFRSGRVFLAADAAHTHSPAAAQGMNIGIQDACNRAACAANAQEQPSHRSVEGIGLMVAAISQDLVPLPLGVGYFGAEGEDLRPYADRVLVAILVREITRRRRPWATVRTPCRSRCCLGPTTS